MHNLIKLNITHQKNVYNHLLSYYINHIIYFIFPENYTKIFSFLGIFTYVNFSFSEAKLPIIKSKNAHTKKLILLIYSVRNQKRGIDTPCIKI